MKFDFHVPEAIINGILEMKKAGAKECVLVVDDALDTLEVVRRNLAAKGFQVLSADSVAEALKVLNDKPVDLVITDLKMPGASGLELIRHVRENLKNTQVMMITGYPSIDGAVEAVKSGAEEYLPKPFTDEELLSAVRRSLEKLRLRRSLQGQPRQFPSPHQGIVGESEAMQKVFRALNKAAATSATVLITGESGVGKELVARAIHYNSDRSAAPFVPVNCGAIPENLLENELFGHVKGAFTGASESRAGFFQTADKGTIFLDEISETSLSMQTKLLRVLEDKEVYMVGLSRSQKVDVRILASTNKILAELVKMNLFREDLFFRLNVITIEIPPLRERADDVMLLAGYFVNKSAKDLGKPPVAFSESALQMLKNYQWPGNVRELKNAIYQLMVMADGQSIDAPDLPSLMRFSALRENGLNKTLAQVEAEYIRSVLARCDGNKTKAAKILAIDRKTLREKLGD